MKVISISRVALVVISLFIIFSGCSMVKELTRRPTQAEIDEAMGPPEPPKPPTQEEINNQKKAQRLLDTMPFCDNEADCAAKWEAAQAWVATNCGMKIQTVTNVLIQTYGSDSTKLAATVIKEPKGDGKYNIKASIYCGNIFGCIPNQWDALQGFQDYVNGFGTKKIIDNAKNDAGILSMLKKLNPSGFSRASDEVKQKAIKCVKEGYQNCEVLLDK